MNDAKTKLCGDKIFIVMICHDAENGFYEQFATLQETSPTHVCRSEGLGVFRGKLPLKDS